MALLFVALLIGATLAVSPAQAAETTDFEVLPSQPPRDREAEETTDRLLVRFRERANLSSWSPRTSDDDGEKVGDELRSRASRAQRKALGLIERRRAEADGYWISNSIVVEGADAGLRRDLAALPEVAEVRPERRYRMERPVDVTQVEAAAAVASTAPDWGVTTIGAERAWDQGVLGGGVVIASIDSGVEFTHPAITTQYRGNLGDGRFEHDYNWFDASETCAGDAPCDLVGHGTHTMGTMVGGDGPGPFVPDIGVAPAAEWISVGCGPHFCDESQLMAAGQWILAPFGADGAPADASKRPHIVNNSWGTEIGGDTTMQDMVRAWRAAGIVPVFSSGNSGSECQTVGSPGDYPESFTVGATGPDDVVADFSSRGATVSGLAKPDVSAPGVDVLSAVPGGEYAQMSGTSMAAPHVAGTLALALAAAPELRNDPSAATTALARTAVDRVDQTCGGDADGDPNNIYGEGRIDAAAVVEEVASGGRLEGRMTISGSDAGLGGARVRAVGGEIDNTTITRSDGTYALLLPAGTYRVEVEIFGYLPASRDDVAIEAGSTAAVDLAVVAAPTYEVSGTVRASEGNQTLERVVVQPLGVPVGAATTDAVGRYSLRLPSGAYDLRATRGGCLAPVTTRTTVANAAVVADYRLATKTDRRGNSCQPSSTTWVNTTQATGLTGNRAYGRLDLPFAVSHYGQSYRTVYVTVDGYLTFDDPYYSSGWNDSIPSFEYPNNAIYPLWQELVVEDDAAITYATLGYTSSTRRVVVTYENVRAEGSSTPVSFQVHIWANGAVDILYRDMAGVQEGAVASIGIEDSTGDDGLQFSFFERSALSDTAWRYQQTATATATGSVVDANDGRAVAGSIVTAEPGGRTAVTDGSGRYSLSLLPGTYTVTASAPRYAAVSSAPVTVRSVRSSNVPALRLTAPVATVEPESLALRATLGQTTDATVTLTNPGSAPLRWSVIDREATTDPIPPVSIATDATGDALSTVDVVGLSGSSNGQTLSMKIDYSATTEVPTALGVVQLDTDQDPSTGEPSVNHGGLDAHDLGVDHTVILYGLAAEEPFVEILDATTDEVVATAPGGIDGQSMYFDIPVDVLGPDEDGSVDAVVMAGSYMGASDWVPDAGHASIEVGRDTDWMEATPASGVLAPNASVAVEVRAGGASLAKGRRAGELRFLTDAPRQPKVAVPVTFNVK